MPALDPALPPAVVMGLSPTGLHVVRALGRAGVRVIGTAQNIEAGRASRYLSDCIDKRDPAARLEALCRVFPETPAEAAGRPVLMPTSDQDVDFVIAHADRLSRHFAFQDSYRDGLAQRIMSKDSFYGFCAEHGVRFPRLLKVEREGLSGLGDRLRFPVLVKPARIHEIKDKMRGRKGWTISDASVLREVASQIPDGAGTLIAQEIVTGPESAITLFCAHFDRHGCVRHAFTARKLRQFPPGFGSASLVQSTPEPDSARIAAGLLLALRYRGIAAAEFKRDPESGELAIIEINVRPSLWFSLSEAAGRPVVLSAYRELAGLPDDRAEIPQQDGVRWRYAAKDVWSSRFYRRTTGFVLPAPDIETVGPASRRTGAVYSVDDPAPLLADIANFALKALARLGSLPGLVRRAPRE